MPRGPEPDVPKGPERLSDIMGRLFTARGWGRSTERQRLEAAWAKVAGAEVAGKTRVLGLKKGLLEVEVRGGGALLHELAGFHKRRLITELKQLLPGHPLKDLRFRSGAP